MNQPLHIFRKDVRHLWPELVTYAVLLITFAWAVPQGWLGAEPNSLLQILMVLLRALIPILWLVVIARLIQDESLVGDQQFWITRPYTRGSLLGAKLLFLAVCVALPFALMQCYLLFHAGLHPLASIPALSLNLLFLTLLCWLPFAAVSAVTSTLPRMAMSLVGTLIVSIIVMVVLGRTLGLRMQPPYFLQVIGTVFTILLAVTVLYQYRTRNTKYSRIALLAAPVLLFVLFVVYPTKLIVPHRFSTTENTAHLVFDPDPSLQEPQDGKETSFGGQLLLDLPIHLEGLAPKARLSDGGVSVTLDAPGYHYQSSWLPGGLSNGGANLFLPTDVVRKLQSTPAHLHMVLVSDQLLPGTPEQATAASRFDIPGHGVCFLSDDAAGSTFCRYPYHSPAPTEVTGPITLPPCGPGSPSRNGVYQVRSFVQPVFDPVSEESPRMGPGTICPGAQLSFTAYKPGGHIRAELDVPAIVLGAYVHHNRPLERGMPATAPMAPPAGATAPAPPATAPQPAHPPAAPKTTAP